mmetsp:Transcript_66207/g.175408  ORF Transcript_66207/g.175408 Transcript_66207/m.175408 type:complete len:264 (-) Transcript_66207:475-1266(-)
MKWGLFFLDGCIVGSDLSITCTFVALILQMRSAKSAEGLSLQTLIAVVTSRILHFFSQSVGIHYRPNVLPSDMYYMFDVVNVVVGLGCIALFMKHRATYEVDKDNFGLQLFERFDLLPRSGPFANRSLLAASFIYVITGALAFLWSCFRRSSGSWKVTLLCCSYEAMCVLSLLPQLWMFHQDKWVSQLLGRFVVMVAVSRACTGMFWLSYPWIVPYGVPLNRTTQLCTEALNILVLADFLFYFIRSTLRGDKRIRVGSEFDKV